MQSKRWFRAIFLMTLIAVTPALASCSEYFDDDGDDEATPTADVAETPAVEEDETPIAEQEETPPRPVPGEETPEGTPDEMPEATPAGTPDPDDPTAVGEQIFANVCAACHQPDGEGIDGIYPALAGSGFVTIEDPAPVIDVVLTGRGGMPRFGDTYSDEEIAAIVTYIRTSLGNDASEVDAETVQEVRQSIQEDAEEQDESGSGQTEDPNE